MKLDSTKKMWENKILFAFCAVGEGEKKG